MWVQISNRSLNLFFFVRLCLTLGDGNYSLFTNVCLMTIPYSSLRIGTCFLLFVHDMSLDCLIIAFLVKIVPFPERPA